MICEMDLLITTTNGVNNRNKRKNQRACFQMAREKQNGSCRSLRDNVWSQIFISPLLEKHEEN